MSVTGSRQDVLPLQLQIVEGPQAGQEFELAGPAVIGRSSRSSDIVLDDPEVSRQHASVIPKGESLNVEDLGSTNGTFVNGERIDRTQDLVAGDRLRIGMSVLELRLGGAAEEDEPGEPDEAAAEEDHAAEPGAYAEAEQAEASEGEAAEVEVAEEEPAESEGDQAEAAEAEPAEDEPGDEEPAEAEPGDEEAAEAEAAEGEAAEGEAAGDEPAESEPVEAEGEPAEDEPPESVPAEAAEAEPATAPTPAPDTEDAVTTAKALHARVVESFNSVLRAWSNRDADSMGKYVSRDYLERARSALQALEADFQVNCVEDLELRDVAVRRPDGDAPPQNGEAYVAFLARDWIEDLRTREPLDGDAGLQRAFMERWAFVREGRRGWVIDSVESVWTGTPEEAAQQAWPGLPEGWYSRRNRPATWRQWDGTGWVATG